MPLILDEKIKLPDIRPVQNAIALHNNNLRPNTVSRLNSLIPKLLAAPFKSAVSAGIPRHAVTRLDL